MVRCEKNWRESAVAEWYKALQVLKEDTKGPGFYP